MARIFDDSMNGVLYCDVLQKELKQSIVLLPDNNSYIYFNRTLLGAHI